MWCDYPIESDAEAMKQPISSQPPERNHAADADAYNELRNFSA